MITYSFQELNVWTRPQSDWHQNNNRKYHAFNQIHCQISGEEIEREQERDRYGESEKSIMKIDAWKMASQTAAPINIYQLYTIFFD